MNQIFCKDMEFFSKSQGIRRKILLNYFSIKKVVSLP